MVWLLHILIWAENIAFGIASLLNSKEIKKNNSLKSKYRFFIFHIPCSALCWNRTLKLSILSRYWSLTEAGLILAGEQNICQREPKLRKIGQDQGTLIFSLVKIYTTICKYWLLQH